MVSSFPHPPGEGVLPLNATIPPSMS